VGTVTGTRKMGRARFVRAMAGMTVLLVVFALTTSPASSKPGTDWQCGGIGVTIVGTPGNDVVIGTPGNDVIQTFGGDDVIFGTAGRGTDGNDVICGGDGNDVIYGGVGNDWIIDDSKVIGSTNDDVIYGGDGNDWITAGSGNDAIYGGGGTDTLDFSRAPAGVSVNLSSGKVSRDGYGVPDAAMASVVADSVTRIENIGGSSYDDSLTGNAGDNVINGGGGTDTINGKGGKDTIDGVRV